MSKAFYNVVNLLVTTIEEIWDMNLKLSISSYIQRVSGI